MKTIEVNGIKIETNLGEHYNMCKGNDKKTMALCCSKFRESDEEMFNRLAKYYTKITFYETATRVKGYHNLIAYCK